MDSDWQRWAAEATVISIVGGILIVVARRWLHGEFVGLHAHSALATRVGAIEAAKGTEVTRAEFQQNSDRLGRVETGVAVLQESVNGAGEGIRRVEHNVNLLLEHALKGDKT